MNFEVSPSDTDRSTWQTERNGLLQRIVTALRSDDRVQGVWLEGSFGRQNADAWSDLDIGIVVSDDAIPALLSNPLEFVHGIVPTIMAKPVPPNAPPGGAYAITLIAGESGPQQVDWYWHAASSARMPAHARVLFAHTTLTPPVSPPRLTRTEQHRQLRNALDESLFIAYIATRTIRRQDPWAITRHLEYLADYVGQVEWFITNTASPTFEDSRQWRNSGPLPVSIAEQTELVLNALDRLHDPVARFAPDLKPAWEQIRSWVASIDLGPSDASG